MSWSPNYPWAPNQGEYSKTYPTRVISDEDILELGEGQQQTLIGHTLSYCTTLEVTCQQATEAAEKYYNRLVELGDIVPPKSAEELIQEQAAQQQKVNAELLKTIQALTEKIDKLEGEKDEPDTNSANSSTGIQPKAGGASRKGTKELQSG